jgi:hypothetical protein
MIRTCTTCYFYPLNASDSYAERDTRTGVLLSHLIGETLAAMFLNRDCPVELMRINYGEGNRVIAMRRISDIKVTVESVKHI